jgi:hypothetical protein
VSGTGGHRPGEPVDVFDLLDDETIDALITGEPVDPRLDDLAGFAREAQALGEGPPPRPSPALATLMARGGASAERTSATARASRVRRRRVTSVAASLAGLGALAKVALSASLGVAGVAAAGAAGVLPGPANRQVRQVIEATTPIDFREPADDRPSHDRPTTTPSPADDDGGPTSEAPVEPGRPRGRQDPAGGRGEQGSNGEGSDGQQRGPAERGGQERRPAGPSGQERNPAGPGSQERGPAGTGGQQRGPAERGGQERRAPAVTTTEPADRGHDANPAGQGQERRAPGNSDGKGPEQPE